jgi:hypothetical protein
MWTQPLLICETTSAFRPDWIAARSQFHGWRNPLLQFDAQHSPVAQLAEQPTVNRQVTGSSPVGGANPQAKRLEGFERLARPPVNSITWFGLMITTTHAAKYSDYAMI